MPRYEKSVDIARPIAEVIAYMDDVEREREWQPNLVAAEQIPPGPTALGTRKRYVSEFMGKRLENTYVVEEIDEGRRVVLHTAPDSILDARTEIRWAEVPGGTRVTMILEGEAAGFLRLVPAWIIEAKFAEQVEGALTGLKARLESSR
jgi:Polyketide cyclase / dehydrase and lipid transport